MPRFAANLSMMFNEVPFLERFGAAKAAGFTAVEYLFPYDFSAEDLAGRLQSEGLTQALFNLPPGDWAEGERGIACLPGREQEFADGVDRAIVYAQALGNRPVHAMAGLRPEGVEPSVYWATYLDNLKVAAAKLKPAGLTLLVEPINPRSMPGYALDSMAKGAEVVRAMRAAGHDNVGLQFDVFHCQIIQGDVAHTLRQMFPLVGHVQIAGVPERHEPDIGELNYPYLFGVLDELGYEGWVGCEYVPAGKTEEGLGWLRP
jgi:hydroxypyruvate isomerase